MQRLFRAQGATEYLVLLAIVLIIALVGIALLGFFPGTASDAQVAESKIYWQSATPIAITEWAAKADNDVPNQYTYPYLRIKNTGSYRVTITKMLGAGGQYISQYCNGTSVDFSAKFSLAPGEESFFGTTGYPAFYSLPENRNIEFQLASISTSSSCYLYAASAVCSNSTPYGTLVVKDFGFEYIQYVEGQAITKRQIGTKPLMIKCG